MNNKTDGIYCDKLKNHTTKRIIPLISFYKLGRLEVKEIILLVIWLCFRPIWFLELRKEKLARLCQVLTVHHRCSSDPGVILMDPRKFPWNEITEPR